MREHDPERDGLHNQAFNEGCDARLAGQTALANPYAQQQHIQYRAWLMGWWDVHDHWGEKNAAAQELQPVRSEA